MAFFNKQQDFINAAHNGDVKAVKHLLGTLSPYTLTGGFNRNAPDKEGKTALYHAAEQGHVSIIKLLLGYNVDTALADTKGVTPLMAAVLAQKPRAVEILLEESANPNLPDKDYTYPLHHAAFLGDFDSVTALIKAKADVNLRIRANNRTALHWAVDKGFAEIVAALLDAGASMTLPDNANKTPMDIARNKKRMPIIQLLEQAEQKRNPAPAHKTLPPEPMDDAAPEEWVLANQTCVAHISHYAVLHRRLTEVFNLESRERLIIAENLKTGAESIAPAESFDGLETAQVEKAFAAYQRLGGTAVSAENVFRHRLIKPTVPAPAAKK